MLFVRGQLFSHAFSRYERDPVELSMLRPDPPVSLITDELMDA